jgi:HSP20 family molecular chaperone IbpA
MWSRFLSLPSSVKDDDVNASITDGVLKIEIH